MKITQLDLPRYSAGEGPVWNAAQQAISNG
ncbi:hypothetical protein FHS61_002244 [Altererythrobacter atlanticus]|nr:hypothetical protein [Croceibacterium atlanticum]